jgi:hypothetical protein
MTTLGKRLDALEEIAEACRRREWEDQFRTELVERHQRAGVPIAPEQIEAKLTRAVALAGRMQALADDGLSLNAIAYRVAVEHDLDPERVVGIFTALQAERRS